MYSITKEFHFSASHTLKGLAENHPCSNLHGHNYKVIVEFRSEKLKQPGFIIDYRDLAPIKEWLDKNFDHKNLNDVVGFNPTAEYLAQYFYEAFVQVLKLPVYSVTVCETDKTTATYYG